MGERGPKSKAALSVVSAADTVEVVRRPDPPDELSFEQAAEWRAVVERLPAEWFPRETHAVLAQYCRHVVTAKRVAQLIEQAEAVEPVDIDDLDKLYKMQEREARIMSSLATRMRITQQTTYDKSKKKPTQVQKPWES